MKLIKPLCLIAGLILKAHLLFSINAEDVLEQNIPRNNKTSGITLSFRGTRDRDTGSLNQGLLNTLKASFNIRTFIETGTYLGGTTKVAEYVFSEVHTIELSRELFIQACHRFQYSENVFVHHGDSGNVLQEILPGISERILFYLDGHYSEADTVRGESNTPILDELKAIYETGKNQSVILIDDIRLFQNSAYPEKIKNTCLEGYPDLRTIVETLLSINPTYQICFFGDALLAYPKAAHISVTPVVRACAIQRLSIAFPEFPENLLQMSMDIIANALENERNELMNNSNVYSDFELNYGFRSFSALWHGLLLLQDGNTESAVALLKRAADQSPPGWCIDMALQRAEKKIKNSSEDLSILTTALEINQKSFPIIADKLNQYEYALYENDETYLKEFPLSIYEKISVPDQGVFYINDIDDSIKNQLRMQVPWERTNQCIIQQFVKPGTVALDIGSHIGTHAVTMSKCVGEHGEVLAFEPNKAIYRELCYNLAANECKNAYAIRSAIGKKKKVIEVVSSHPRNEGGSYVVEQKEGQNTAVLLPLDALNLNNISFIKIDVENMEADVLDGAKETIMRNRPVMLIEVQGNGDRTSQLGENSAEMAMISLNKIKNLKYNVTRIEDGCDYLAIPKETP